MKVVDRNMNSGPPVESGRTQDAQRTSTTAEGSGASAGAAQAGSGDQVEFSTALGSLARAMSTFNANGVSKVQGITADYQSGVYQADSLATSRSMVAYALTAGAE